MRKRRNDQTEKSGMGPIHSRRLAAFRLGYHVRLLRSILASGIEADLSVDHDVHGCIEKIDDAVLVLSEMLSAPEFLRLDSSLRAAGELHDIVCEIGPSEAADSERRAVEKLEHKQLAWIELLSGKIVQRDSTLDSWHEVGIALADLRHRVAYVYVALPIPDIEWNRLNDAIDRLPLEDRSKAQPFMSSMHFGSLTDLAVQIVEVYGDISQLLSTPDRTALPGTGNSTTNHEESNLTHGRPSPDSTMVTDTTGLIHSTSYSICKAKGVTYNLKPPAQALVHALNAWRREEVIAVEKKDVFDRAMQLYLDDSKMTEVIESMHDRQISKVFEDSGAWKTLVKPFPGRKGLYTLDL